jgi:anti-anti-sigma factor
VIERPVFDIRQRDDADGTLRVTLVGELDIAVADRLTDQLGRLRHSRRPVRLDLSELEFIDCRGIGGILTVLADARRERWDFEVDRRVSPGVRRITDVADVASALWPAPGPRPRVGAGHL